MTNRANKLVHEFECAVQVANREFVDFETWTEATKARNEAHDNLKAYIEQLETGFRRLVDGNPDIVDFNGLEELL